MSADAVAWVTQHGPGLTGQPVADAARLVREAGLTPRTLEPDAIVTLEFRPDRVDLHRGPDGLVRAVRAG